MKKTLFILGAVYAAGVVFDTVVYARANGQTYGQVLSTPHPWLWPYYAGKGIAANLSPQTPPDFTEG